MNSSSASQRNLIHLDVDEGDSGGGGGGGESSSASGFLAYLNAQRGSTSSASSSSSSLYSQGIPINIGGLVGNPYLKEEPEVSITKISSRTVSPNPSGLVKKNLVIPVDQMEFSDDEEVKVLYSGPSKQQRQDGSSSSSTGKLVINLEEDFYPLPHVLKHESLEDERPVLKHESLEDEMPVFKPRIKDEEDGPYIPSSSAMMARPTLKRPKAKTPPPPRGEQPDDDGLANLLFPEGDEENMNMMQDPGEFERIVLDTMKPDVENEQILDKRITLLKEKNGEERMGTPAGMNSLLYEHQLAGLAWLTLKEDAEEGGLLADDMGLGKTVQAIALLHERRLKLSAQEAATLIVCPLAVLRQWEREINVHSERKLKIYVHHGPKRLQNHKDLRSFDVVITTYDILTGDMAKGARTDTTKSGKVIRVAPTPPATLFRAKFRRVFLDESQIIRNSPNQSSIASSQLKKVKFKFSLTGTPIQNGAVDIYAQFRFLDHPLGSIRLSEFKQQFPSSKTPIPKDADEMDMDDEDRSEFTDSIQRLQGILRNVMLRRTKSSKNSKGENIVVLPAKNTHLVKLRLSPAEQNFYFAIENKALASLANILNNADDGSRYTSMLTLLLRMRQASTHPHLIKVLWADAMAGNFGLDFMNFNADDEDDDGYINDEEDALASIARPGSSGKGKKGEDLSPNLEKARKNFKASVFDILIASAINGALFGKECPACDDVCSVSEQSVLTCGHLVCNECIEGIPLNVNASDLDEPTKNCPACRQPFKISKLVEARIFKKVSKEKKSNVDFAKAEITETDLKKILTDLHPDGNFNNYITSTKVEKLLEVLLETRKNNKMTGDNVKTVVFSQWTGLLDIIGEALRLNYINYCRYDGSMKNDEREEALNQFANKSRYAVILVSLKAGGVGLNLTAASQVVMMDLWWNPSVEEQAIDRVYRIGQKRACEIYRFSVEDTVEDRILLLQEKKKRIAEGALGEGKFRLPKLTLQDLKGLFSRKAGTGNINLDELRAGEGVAGPGAAAPGAAAPGAAVPGAAVPGAYPGAYPGAGVQLNMAQFGVNHHL